MQIKTFTIPILGGETINEELNLFLRSRKVLQVEKELLLVNGSGFWCFCVTWMDGVSSVEKEKPDYKKVLDEVTFKRFSNLRDIRRRLAQDEAIPAYAIFTDEELAAFSKVEKLTQADMKTVKGVGEKKIEKYGAHFIEKETDATGE